MSTKSLKSEELQREIEIAFADVRYPGDDHLVYDSPGQHLECSEVASAFRGRGWRDLSLEMLSYHSSALFCFTPEAFRFYLPAYLIAATVHYEETDALANSVVFSLIAPSDPKDVAIYGEMFKRRMQNLTATERKAIRSFLGFLKERHAEDDPLGNADKALASLEVREVKN